MGGRIFSPSCTCCVPPVSYTHLALIAEIRSGGDMVRSNRLRPRTFYMGGGTPGILTPDQMDAILTALEESFDLSACPEITVEIGRPDTITAEKLAVLKSHGVTRVCVNPQTMEDHVLDVYKRQALSPFSGGAGRRLRQFSPGRAGPDGLSGTGTHLPVPAGGPGYAMSQSHSGKGGSLRLSLPTPPPGRCGG